MPKKSRRTGTISVSVKGRNIGLFAVLLNTIFWGIASPIIKVGLDQVSPQVFLYYRFLIVLVLTTPFIILYPKLTASINTPKKLLEMLLIGFLTNPLSLGILFLGLSYTTSAAGAILAGMSPLFIIAGSWLFLHEKISTREIVGVGLAAIGMIVIALDTPVQTHALNPTLGNALVIGHNIFWMVAVLWMKKLSKVHHPFAFGYTGWFMGFVTFLITILFTEPYFVLRPLMITQLPEALFGITYMAIFGSIVAFTAYQVAQKYLTASEVSIFSYLQPLVSIPLSIFWLQEKTGFMFFLGCVVIAVGVAIAEWHGKSRARRIVAKR